MLRKWRREKRRFHEVWRMEKREEEERGEIGLLLRHLSNISMAISVDTEKNSNRL